MKKFTVIFLLVILSACKMAAEDKVKLSVLDEGRAEYYNLNPLDFNMAFMERFIYGLGIYKQAAIKDIVGSSYSILSVLNRRGSIRMEIKNYKGTKDLQLDMYFKELKGNDHLFFLTNYSAAEDRIISEDENKDDVWVMLYVVKGDRLIGYKYVLGEKKAPDGTYRTSLANYYMQDQDSGNDDQIEPLLIKDIKDDSVKYKAFTYGILSQYYMMTGDLKKAKAALSAIKKHKVEKSEISVKELYYVTALEYMAVEMFYKKNNRGGL